MSFTLIAEILGIVAAIPVIGLIIRKVYQFLSRHLLNTDVACSVLYHKIGHSCHSKIKLAYSGEKAIVLSDIHLTYKLTLPAPIDSFWANFQIAIGYIVWDMKGLTTVLGTKEYRTEPLMVHRFKWPRFIKYPISTLYGLLFFYILLLEFAFFPLGWLFLFSGPYSKFSLISINQSKIITDENGNLINLPLVLNPGTTMELDIKYKLGLNAKGFETDTPYRYLEKYPRRSFLLPKPGKFVWRGIGNIDMNVGKRLNRLKAVLPDRIIISIGG